MLGNLMVISTFLGIYKFIVSNKYLGKILYGIFVVLSLFVLILSKCRSTLLGLFASVFIFFFFYSWRLSKKATLTISFCILILFFMFHPYIQEISRSTFSADETGTIDRSTIGRILIWKGAISHFAKAPIIEKLSGIGMGNFITVRYNHFLEAGRFTTGAHNNFLHVLIELGVVGLIIYITLFILQLVLLYKKKTDLLAQIYLFATLTLLFSSLTQETFWFQPVFGNFWMLQMVFLALAL
jgi:O-antigen ligase